MTHVILEVYGRNGSRPHRTGGDYRRWQALGLTARSRREGASDPGRALEEGRKEASWQTSRLCQIRCRKQLAANDRGISYQRHRVASTAGPAFVCTAWVVIVGRCGLIVQVIEACRVGHDGI